MQIKVKSLKEKQIIPDKVEDLFFKEWEANKHNINLTEEDYNLALFYYNVGYSIGFHKGFEAQKSTTKPKASGHNTRLKKERVLDKK